MKPTMIRREICYPAPEEKVPVKGTRYYVPSVLLNGMISEFLWADDELDRLHCALPAGRLKLLSVHCHSA